MKSKFSFLTLTLLIAFAMNSCSPNYLKGYKELIYSDIRTPRTFNGDFQKAKYKARLKIMGRELSGIALIKKTSENSSRIVFMSEIGMKYFDIEVLADKGQQITKTYYLMSVLDRAEVKKILENDLLVLLSDLTTMQESKVYRDKNASLVFMKSINEKHIYAYRSAESNSFEKIAWNSKPEGKSVILLNYNESSHPEKIEINNKKYGLNFNLILI